MKRSGGTVYPAFLFVPACIFNSYLECLTFKLLFDVCSGVGLQLLYVYDCSY